MGVYAGPEISEAGLILHLDVANFRSYPASGTTWIDLSGNGNNGTLINDVEYTSSNLGSLIFDGINDYVSLGTSSSLDTTLNGSTNWTISYWIKYTQNGRILDAGNIGTDPTGALELNATSIGVNNIATTSNFTGSISSSNWNFITLSKNSSRLHSWYLNGVFSNSSTTTADYSVSSQIWKIGRRALSTSSMYGGNIAQISIYNKILTANEVYQNYNALKGRFGI